MLSTTISRRMPAISFGIAPVKQQQEKKEERPVVNVAINGGLGRIGKSLFRMIEGPQYGFGIVNDSTYRLIDKAQDGPIVNLVSMNLSKEMDTDSLISALRHDTTLRQFPGKLSLDTSKADSGEIYLNVADRKGNNEHQVRIFNTKDINELKWGETKADIIIDATGYYNTKAKMQPHLDQGALRGIITRPDGDKNPAVTRRFVAGVNSDQMKIAHEIFSAASCTTTCIAPIIKVLNDEYGVKHGFIQSTHSDTASQFVQDKGAPKGKDGAKMKSVFNIIPTTTGAAKAIGDIIPELKGKLDGLAARVPVVNGSLAYIVLEMEKPVSKEEVVKLLNDKSQTNQYKDLLAKAPKDAASSDINSMHQSALYVEDQISIINDTMVAIPAFYDNEWGYTRSVLDLAKQAGQQLNKAGKSYAQQAVKAQQLNVLV